jgi:hypothetical protein
VALDQLRLVIKRVALARRAGHKQLHDALSPLQGGESRR